MTFTELGALARSVVLAVLPLAFLFLLFQIFFLKLPAREVSRILTGTLIATLGLFLFLAGVNVGFVPFGSSMGAAIGVLQHKWTLALLGIVLGFVTTWGEPSVRILADQVESASTGSIRRSAVLWAICTGVAIAVGVGLLRIAYGIPLLYLLVPGYVLVIIVMWLSDRRFVSIAIDAGGVATGPFANTFLLALALGASAAAGDLNPMVQGLGLVSLIALAPLISVMALGLLVRRKTPYQEPAA